MPIKIVLNNFSKVYGATIDQQEIKSSAIMFSNSQYDHKSKNCLL